MVAAWSGCVSRHGGSQPRILKSLETPPDISTDDIERIVFDISALGLADFFAADFEVPEEMEDDHVFLKALATTVERSPDQMKEIVARWKRIFGICLILAIGNVKMPMMMMLKCGSHNSSHNRHRECRYRL